jgi:hypothetical protein
MGHRISNAWLLIAYLKMLIGTFNEEYELYFRLPIGFSGGWSHPNGWVRSGLLESARA